MRARATPAAFAVANSTSANGAPRYAVQPAPSGTVCCTALNATAHGAPAGAFRTSNENAALPILELTDLADPIVAQMVWMKLKAVGLADAGRLYPRELSGGMKKRAAIARAIALDPDLVVLDEPSAGLDPIIAAGLDELILFLKRGFGMTVLVVTHALDSAFRIADRVAMLYQGSLIAVDTPAEFKASTHPRVRQFVQGEPERLSDASEGFAASFLKEFHA